MLIKGFFNLGKDSFFFISLKSEKDLAGFTGFSTVFVKLLLPPGPPKKEEPGASSKLGELKLVWLAGPLAFG